MAGAYAATYRDELPPITADLPPAEPAQDARTNRERKESLPFGRSRRRRGFFLVALAAMALGVWAIATSGPVWPAILLGALAIMLARHSRSGHHCRVHGRTHGWAHGWAHGRVHGDQAWHPTPPTTSSSSSSSIS